MADKLKVLVCSGFKDYFEKVASNEFEDIEICPFPSMCVYHSGEAKGLSSIRNILKDSPEDVSIVCGSLCPAMKVLEEDYRIRTETQDICFSHILGKSFVEHLVSGGGYMVTEPWLRNWKEHLSSMGFDRELARRFFGESARRIVCVSEEKREENIPYLEDFSQYVDLPFLVVEADYSYIEILLNHLHSMWQLKKARKENDSRIRSFRKQSADYMTMFELIKDLTQKENESDVIETVKKSLSMLFSCRLVEFCSARRDEKSSLDKKCILFLRSGEQYSLLENSSGFMLRIEHSGQTEGILVFRDFQFPSHISGYLSFCLNISDVIGLAISNSKKIEIIRKNESEMEYIGTHDGMTGIFNRGFFDEKVKELQQKEISEGLCVLVCDLDGLKEINDIKGHDAGDIAIKATVHVLKKSLRTGDILARTGGDEFAAILPGYPESSLENLSERILNNLEKYNRSSKNMPLSFSFGLVHGFPPEDDILELVRGADEIMYKRKIEKKETCQRKTVIENNTMTC